MSVSELMARKELTIGGKSSCRRGVAESPWSRGSSLALVGSRTRRRRSASKSSTTESTKYRCVRASSAAWEGLCVVRRAGQVCVAGARWYESGETRGIWGVLRRLAEVSRGDGEEQQKRQAEWWRRRARGVCVFPPRTDVAPSLTPS